MQPRKDVEEQRVPALLKLGEHTRLEEDLRRADAEDGLVELERVDHAQTRLPAVHVPARDHARREHLVPLAELDEVGLVFLVAGGNEAVDLGLCMLGEGLRWE